MIVWTYQVNRGSRIWIENFSKLQKNRLYKLTSLGFADYSTSLRQNISDSLNQVNRVWIGDLISKLRDSVSGVSYAHVLGASDPGMRDHEPAGRPRQWGVAVGAASSLARKARRPACACPQGRMGPVLTRSRYCSTSLSLSVTIPCISCVVTA